MRHNKYKDMDMNKEIDNMSKEEYAHKRKKV